MTIEEAREAIRQPLTAEVFMDPDLERRVELGVQSEHIEQVLGTTLALKATLISIGAPDRVYGYMKGTGLPLPKENKRLRKVLDLPYGEGPLRYYPHLTVAGHKGNLGVYIAQAENGGQSTWLVHEGRDHAYSKSNLLWLNHKLALVPRVLRGIADGVFTTFATGWDGVMAAGDSPFDVGDVGIMISNTDLTGWGALVDPGAGDQTITRGVFGGEFQAGVRVLKPNMELIAPFVAGFHDAVTSDPSSNNSPHLHLAHLYDCKSLPHFENELDTAEARIITREVQDMAAIPTQFLDLVRSSPIFVANLVQQLGDSDRIPKYPIGIAHGMATKPEIAAYAQEDTGLEPGVDTRYKQRLPFIALLGCTDIVDPRPGGASYATSHANIMRAVQLYDQFLAPALTNCFLEVTANPPQINK